MPHYVMLMRYRSHGVKEVRSNPGVLLAANEALERWEAKILHSFHLLGEWDQCAIVDAPDNLKVYRASIAHEISATADIDIMPAIDFPLFQRLVSQDARIAGPHHWQTRFWAKAGRRAMRHYAFTRWVNRYCKPLTVTGRDRLKGLKGGPCIVIGNHSSHMDHFVLFHALPEWIKWNIYFGAAADRWFLKGRREITLQPWYQSLVNGSYPIRRGGGSAALDYPKWLLEQGCNIMIFPEGTRARGRGLSRFKHGVSILALEHNVPVVPVYLAGLRKMRPVGTRAIKPGPAGAHILEPIVFEAGTTVPEATQRMYDAMHAVHERVLDDGDDAADDSFRHLRGSGWEGDLEAMRSGRSDRS